MSCKTYHIVKSLLLFPVPCLLTLGAVSTPERDDDLSWLRYWVVISLFLVLEIVLDKIPLLPSLVLPKLCFILWFLLPDPCSGTKIVFDLIQPTFTLYQSRLSELSLPLSNCSTVLSHLWYYGSTLVTKAGVLSPTLQSVLKLGGDILPTLTATVGAEQ